MIWRIIRWLLRIPPEDLTPEPDPEPHHSPPEPEQSGHFDREAIDKGTFPLHISKEGKPTYAETDPEPVDSKPESPPPDAIPAEDIPDLPKIGAELAPIEPPAARRPDPEPEPEPEPITFMMPPGITGIPAPGFYFTMPDEEYHAVPALDQSGIKMIVVSPADYWKNAPWHYEPAEVDPRKRRQYDRGHAVECIVLEGKAAFHSQFAKEPEPADFEPEDLEADPLGKILVTDADLKAACLDAGLGVGGSKLDKIERLIFADDRNKRRIFQWLEIEYRGEHEGKTFIHPEDYAACLAAETHMSRVNFGVEDVRNKVAIFWKDQDTGIPCKAQMDQIGFIKGEDGDTRRITDIKSFTNSRQMPVEKCAAHHFGQRGVHIQLTFYWHGLDQTLEQAPVSRDTMGEGPWIERLKEAKDNSHHTMAGAGSPEGLTLLIQNDPVNIVPRFFDYGQGGSLTEFGMHADATIRTGRALWIRHMTENGIDRPWGGFFRPRFLSEDEVPPYVFMD